MGLVAENTMGLVAENTLWGPQHGFAVVGKSGGIGRPADDSIVGHCDPIAEREGIIGFDSRQDG